MLARPSTDKARRIAASVASMPPVWYRRRFTRVPPRIEGDGPLIARPRPSKTRVRARSVAGMSSPRGSLTRAAEAVPPHAWFGVSAVFHYLGPSFAVLLFPAVGVLGVAWLRIASAALILAPWTRPWRVLAGAARRERLLLLGLGACLACMNSAFYLALDRLPMSLVAAIEFVGTVGVALAGLRTRRNLLALVATVAGVLVLIDVRWASDPLGLSWAFLNGALFVGYVLLGHRISQDGASGGVERLGAAMAAAFLLVSPVGLPEALNALADPALLLAGVGVGLCSSVVPYVCDQLAMSRLPRASFALLLALLPASAAVVGAIVLAQVPSGRDVLGVLLVMLGVAIHRPGVGGGSTPAAASASACSPSSSPPSGSAAAGGAGSSSR
jgi:inner membrane transporter RhtA